MKVIIPLWWLRQIIPLQKLFSEKKKKKLMTKTARARVGRDNHLCPEEIMDGKLEEFKRG